MENIINNVNELLQERHPGGKLLYLIKFGSHLYGTDTPNSDLDIKGIFVPSFKSIVMQDRVKGTSFSTGDSVGKNTNEDIDIELWSIQNWLNMVAKGDTGALDLLYSFTNPDSIIFKDDIMDLLFKDPLKLFNPKNTKAYVGYCIGQAKKYGVKGSRLGVIKRVYEWVDKYISDNGNLDRGLRLYSIMDNILDNFGDSSYCFSKIIKAKKGTEFYYNGDRQLFLVLCGKMHQSNITISEFYMRLKSQYEIYGERAKLAEQNKGLDYKALSHALRCIIQCQYLLTMGEIRFPFSGIDLDNIMMVKTGRLSWKEIEPLIVKGLKDVNELQKSSTISGKRNEKFVYNVVEMCYR